MYRRDIKQNLMPFLNGIDENSLLKMQDMMDIVYKINRIKDNSYDNRYLKRINNMSPTEKLQNIMRSFSQNSDKTTKQNVESMINILKNIDSVKNNAYTMSKKQNISAKKHSNINGYTNYGHDDALERIKDFLKSLNE